MKLCDIAALLLATAAFGACGGDGSDASATSAAAELRAFQDEHNDKVREACGAPLDVEEMDSETESAQCYFELAVEFRIDNCTQKAFDGHAEQTREVLACTRERQGKMLACCTKDGSCDYSAAEVCYEAAGEGDRCEPDGELEDALKACDRAQEGHSASTGRVRNFVYGAAVL
jgi:hypothetical protein